MKSFYLPQDMYLCQSEALFYEEPEKELLSITQSLGEEQYRFEFPTRQCLNALAHLDNGENKYSFFDQFSFNTTENVSAQDHMNSPWRETSVEQVVDDSRLSPLQLPSRAPAPLMSREVSCESSTTAKQSIPINPSSFLTKPDSINENVHASDSYYLDLCHSGSVVSGSEFDISTTLDTLKTTESRILIQLSKNNYNSPITIIHQQSHYISSISDEGYDDTEQDEGKELESDCCFYTIQDDEELIRDRAAIQIQSLWRGYISRRQNKHPLTLQITRLFGSYHQRQMKCFQNKMNQLEKKVEKMSLMEKRLEQLEERLEQETAMRRAFENTVEDMAILIDQQQKMTYDRLEEEDLLRQSYKTKMNDAIDQIQPLEARLMKEVSARNRMEDMMTCILDKMQETETARLQQIQKDAETRKSMQTKLDYAMEEITQLKKMNASNTKVNKKTPEIIKKETKQALVTTVITKKDIKSKETKTPINTARRQLSSTTHTPVDKTSLNKRTTMTPKRTLLSRK